MMSRKKRSARISNVGSQIGQQIDGSTIFNFSPMPKIDWNMLMGMPHFGGGGQFNNFNSQVGQQVGRKKRSAQFAKFLNVGSQIGQQIDGSTSFNFGPMPTMNWPVTMGMPHMGGGGQFNNFNSQVGQQVARGNMGSRSNMGMGMPPMGGGGQFNNYGSQIGQ